MCNLRLQLQLLPDSCLTPSSPGLIATGTNRKQDHILFMLDVLLRFWFPHARNQIDIRRQLLTKVIQRKIVHIITKWVFDFTADQEDTEDNVGRADRAGNCYPFQVVIELEGKDDDIDPGYLSDGDRIGNWEGSAQDSIRAGEDVVQGGEVVI
jgi:hypothetical protein